MVNNADKKIALKAARMNNRISSVCINIESNRMRKISSIIGLNKYVPKYYGETYFENIQVIKMDYIN